MKGLLFIATFLLIGFVTTGFAGNKAAGPPETEKTLAVTQYDFIQMNIIAPVLTVDIVSIVKNDESVPLALFKEGLPGKPVQNVIVPKDERIRIWPTLLTDFKSEYYNPIINPPSLE